MKFIKEVIPYILIILVVVLIRTYIVTPVRVNGESMNNTFKNGDILLLSKMDKKYERMDIVVFTYNGERLIKRIIGLPGEKVKIENNKLYINDEEIKDYRENIEMLNYELEEVIEDNHYFVLGDNRNNSIDSRKLGTINIENISGKVIFSIIPFKKIG
ncbi:MAG: signal peptidase I [Bacilli bacterium]|nr:signal peptidase I [Bacilli bacterium]